MSLLAWRRVSQIIFLGIFIILFYMTQYPLDFRYTNGFLRSSPLIMITTLLTNSFSTRFLPAIILVIATLFLGRFFCGWICPVGTISDLIPKTKRKLSKFYRFKYYFLVFVIVSSLFGFNLLVISDPIVIFTRSLVFITHARIPFMLIVIVALVAGLGERFWCRVLCPLGALLGIFSVLKILNLHIGEDCTHCTFCNRVCPMDAIHNAHIKKSECTFCFECVDKCPQGAISLMKKREPIVESRRTFLKAGAGAGAAVLLSPLITSAGASVLRPPGALKEKDFLAVCVRCGECMRVCPSQGLRPVVLEDVYSLFTPKLVPRIGECQLCMLCWQVCPTGALVQVEPETMKLGTALVNRNTCLEWEHEQVCLVCQEVCPFQAVEIVGGQGSGRRNRRGPRVNKTACAGCGACEHHCPTAPSSITVSPEGEIRY